MSQDSTGQQPQTRQHPPPASVSSSPSLADAYSHGAARKPGYSVLSNNLIPRNYLNSLTSSKSDPQQRGKLAQNNGFSGLRSVSDGGKSSGAHRQQGEASLNEDEGSAARNEDTGHSGEEPRLEQRGGSPLSESPKSYTSSLASVPRPTNMPRTSSIDSAISSISNASHVQKQAGEAKEPSREEVQHLIATAGSAENLIQHMLRGKNYAAAQNAQLWKLVDKQRALLLGLNKDLERLTKERDRYRRRVKELQAQPTARPESPSRVEVRQSPQSGEAALHASGEDEPAAGLDTVMDGQETVSQYRDGHSENSPLDPAMMPSPLHLEHPPRLESISTQLAQPSFSVTQATPLTEKPPKTSQASRKAPPKPLNLHQTKDTLSSPFQVPSEFAVSDGEDDDEDRTNLERGRRKTREEDDRDREILVFQEREARSRSKKDKKEKSNRSELAETELSHKSSGSRPTLPSTQAQKAHDHLSPSSSVSHGSSAQLSLPLRSPGLPLSPRPFGSNSTGASFPVSPRAPGSSFPLSPRAPKQPLPAPTTPGQQAPAPEAQSKISSEPPTKINTKAPSTDSDGSKINESSLSPSDLPPVNRSLVSPTWPDLLLPPNALPAVQVKVASSRLRPSRNSILGLKPQEETSVFSLSIFERATSSELWRVQKVSTSLLTLDQQLRSRCTDLPKPPDRRLFSGHSPAVVDARRASIESYFEGLLDTPMDEQAALIICWFLSSDVMEPQSRVPANSGDINNDNTPEAVQGSGIPTKSGYLTKKGKNFGGWKSRYFVLDSPELRYFEAPGGAHLGTIKLLNARIGRQSQTDSTIHPEVEVENQYRHAFLILEPKRKDSNSHVRHVLCAESDAERDEWVETLLHYIDERPEESKSQYGAGIQTPLAKEVKGSNKGGGDGESKQAGSPTGNEANSDTPSPSVASAHNSEVASEPGAPNKAFTISGPMNGAVISDAGLWGNKRAGHGSSKDREQKKRNIFHFKKPSNEHMVQNQTNPPKRTEALAHRGGQVRPVFGMQLQEAVEYYSPVDVDVFLPAVVYRSIEFLRAKQAANEEGLFRLSGSNIVIRQLKDRFNMEGDVDLLADEEDYDVHAVASLFKTYLRELPSTLLTRELHLEFLKVLELADKAQKITAFNSLVHQLPTANFSLLRTLSQYLLEVVQNADRNKMSVKNVGIVFSPTLNIPAPVFAMFLTDFGAIFDHPSDETAVRTTELEREGALTPEDIRSPRRQMFSDLPTPLYNQNSFSQNAATTAAVTVDDESRGHDLDANQDIGFVPMQPSYETRSYVTIPEDVSAQPRYPLQPAPRDPKYDQVDHMLTTDNAASTKAKRRESAMLYM
ncbi:GTPase-activating protein BEM3 [Exophiala dermatitidis]